MPESDDQATRIQKILVPRYKVVCPRERCGFSELCGSLEEASRLASEHDAFHRGEDYCAPLP